MGDCCSPSGKPGSVSRKAPCPGCGREGVEVPVSTIAHHVRQAWTWQPSAERYFFCDTPGCEIAYFGDDGSTIALSRLRTRVGVKERSGSRPLCYCFGVSAADFRRNPGCRDFVLAQTQAGLCSCATSNPSGRCCLKDFPPAG